MFYIMMFCYYQGDSRLILLWKMLKLNLLVDGIDRFLVRLDFYATGQPKA